MWNRLKKRWGITSDKQVTIILVVFALTGFSTLFAHNYIDKLLGIGDDDSFWIKLLVFILIILPLFNVLLLFWGFVFRQQKFFTTFVKLKLKFIFGKNIFKNKD